MSGYKSEITGNNIANQVGGFSVMELLVAITIVAITTAIAMPGYSEMASGFDRFNARAHLLEDLKTGQAYALAQGCRGVFVFATDGRSYDFGCDYLSYDTADPPSPDSIEFSRTLDGDITATPSGTVILNSRGQTVDKDDILTNITFNLKYDNDGSMETFATGSLLATGIFAYD